MASAIEMMGRSKQNPMSKDMGLEYAIMVAKVVGDICKDETLQSLSEALGRLPGAKQGLMGAPRETAMMGGVSPRQMAPTVVNGGLVGG